MVWGCITYEGVGTLTVVDGIINAEKYIDILEDNLWPVIARHFPAGDYIFQDDNAPVHRARVVAEYKARNNIHSMLWPAQSPDLNIIENLWHKLKRSLKIYPEKLDSRQHLADAITDVWKSIRPPYVQNLYSSIPKRLKNVLMSRGYITKY
jgi:transposase